MRWEKLPSVRRVKSSTCINFPSNLVGEFEGHTEVTKDEGDSPAQDLRLLPVADGGVNVNTNESNMTLDDYGQQSFFSKCVLQRARTLSKIKPASFEEVRKQRVVMLQ